MIRLLIVDDEEFVRWGFRAVAAAHPLGLTVVAEAGSVPEAVATARISRPQIAIVDIGIPGGGAATLLRLLPGTGIAVVIYSQEPVSWETRAFLRGAGACSFLSGHEAPEAVITEAIGALGEVGQAHRSGPGTAATVRHLSPREHEVAGLMAAGMRNRDIARQLSLSIRTVEGHRESVRQKLMVDSVSQLTRRFAASDDMPLAG